VRCFVALIQDFDER